VNLPRLPYRGALGYFMACHDRDFVDVYAKRKDAERLSAAELYIFNEASQFTTNASQDVASWRIPIADWPELVRVLDLCGTDPMQAIFDAWIRWDADPWGRIPCFSTLMPDHGRVEGADV